MIFRYRARKEEEGRTEQVKLNTIERKKTKKGLKKKINNIPVKKDLKRMENTNTMNNNFAF